MLWLPPVVLTIKFLKNEIKKVVDKGIVICYDIKVVKTTQQNEHWKLNMQNVKKYSLLTNFG